MLTVRGIDEVALLQGRELGPTKWRLITQEQVDRFADATSDHQWIHVDPERAAASGLGGTIAHGHLTLSLIPSFLSELVEVEGVGMRVNYGLNRVRFPTPVPVGGRVRARALVERVEPIPGGVAVVTAVTIEVEGRPKPACVAETVGRYYREGTTGGGA
ncbi:MAG: MaoC family dehydratase [Candidatus Dormiibacterota bacterium]